MHVLGVEAAVAGEALAGEALVDEALVCEALVAAPSMAHACDPPNAPAVAMIVVARMRNFVMRAPMPQHDDRETVTRQLQGTGSVRAENSDLVASPPQ
jgi:hypothetical protein